MAFCAAIMPYSYIWHMALPLAEIARSNPISSSRKSPHYYPPKTSTELSPVFQNVVRGAVNSLGGPKGGPGWGRRGRAGKRMLAPAPSRRRQQSDAGPPRRRPASRVNQSAGDRTGCQDARGCAARATGWGYGRRYRSGWCSACGQVVTTQPRGRTGPSL